MSIKSYLDELDNINTEIKNNNFRNKFLRKRKKELEENIKKYLNSKDQNGIKYKGKAIILQNKERRLIKKKKEKEEDIISLLKSLGVKNSKKAYQELLNTQKGEYIEEQQLKFQNLSNLKL